MTQIHNLNKQTIMNPQIGVRCLAEALGALAVFKSIHLGISTSHIQSNEPIRITDWSAAHVTRLDKEAKNIVRRDNLLSAAGVSLLYILSPYLRTTLTSGSFQGNIFRTCKDSFSFAQAFLPQVGAFRRITVLSGLVLVLPTLLPPRTTLPRKHCEQPVIDSDVYHPVHILRDFVTFPLLKIFIFHKILFLRILPVVGPVSAHVFSAAACTLATTTQQDHPHELSPMLTQFQESLMMQLSFFVSGGSVVFPFIYSVLRNTKDYFFRVFTSFSIFEHSHLYRVTILQAVKDGDKIYCASSGKHLDTYIERSSNYHASVALAKSLGSSSEVLAGVADRAFTHFSSPSTQVDVLDMMDAVDFIYAFRSAVGRARAPHDLPPRVHRSFGAGTVAGHGATAQQGKEAAFRETLLDPFSENLLPIICTDMAHVLAIEKYPRGMNIADVKDFIAAEIVANGARTLSDDELLKVEEDMYQLWNTSSSSSGNGYGHDRDVDCGREHSYGEEVREGSKGQEQNQVLEWGEARCSTELRGILEEVYASLFRVQLHSCSVLGAQSFKPHRDEESFGALPQLGDSISTRGGDEERLEGLRPGDVEMFFGPSHNLSSAASAATDSVQEEEGSSGDDGAASMMLSVRKEQQQLERGEARGDVGEGTSCDFLNGVLSTVSRREMVAVLAPFGLTIRRFQLLLDRAEKGGDETIGEARRRLQSELRSDQHKEKLREKILKNLGD